MCLTLGVHFRPSQGRRWEGGWEGIHRTSLAIRYVVERQVTYPVKGGKWIFVVFKKVKEIIGLPSGVLFSPCDNASHGPVWTLALVRDQREPKTRAATAKTSLNACKQVCLV